MELTQNIPDTNINCQVFLFSLYNNTTYLNNYWIIPSRTSYTNISLFPDY